MAVNLTNNQTLLHTKSTRTKAIETAKNGIGTKKSFVMFGGVCCVTNAGHQVAQRVNEG